MAGTSADDRSAESRRILDRVARETQRNGFLEAGMRAARRAQSHVSAADADQNDWAELWGTRIGRTVGVAAVFALLLWAFSRLVFGA